jgi:acetyl esterase/lipase
MKNLNPKNNALTLLLGGALCVTVIATPATAQMTGNAAITAALRADRASERPTSQMKAVLNQLTALKPKPLEKLTPRQARQQPSPASAAKELLKKRNIPFPEDVGSVQDRVLPTALRPIRVRIYRPKNAPCGRLPVLMYFHGGGFVIASISTYDASCRALANATGAMVVAVRYRQAPEHRLPAAHEDSYAATQYVMNNAASMGGDPRRVAVCGESAGGNLATSVCLLARERKGLMPIHQALVYPYVDMTSAGLQAPSMRENAKAKPLSRAGVAWFNRWALPSPAAARNPFISPLVSANVRGLPPATVVLAEIDPLRSQGAAYAQKLQRAGVPVRVNYYTGVTHEFFGMAALVPEAKQAVNFVANNLKAAFTR